MPNYKIDKARKNELKKAIANVGKYISGKKMDIYGVRTAFFRTVAQFFYAKIYEAYIVKSEGGTDELGNKWKPLSPSTIAQRPISRGELSLLGLSKKQTGVSIKDRTRGLLTPDENRAWKAIYSSRLRRLLVEYPEPVAKQIAAKLAWGFVKKRGALLKKDVLGSRDVLILRVTDTLLKSLKPTEGTTGDYRPRKYQIYNIKSGSLELGSDVPYAKYHKNVRPPVPDNWREWGAEAREAGLLAAVEHLIKRFQ